jgi:hypothetical protein
LNKRKIGSNPPSKYILGFKSENSSLDHSLKSHFIELEGFGIESDDYGVFLKNRAELLFAELKSRIDLEHEDEPNPEISELLAGDESDLVEFKATLRYDLHTKEVNKKLEHVVAKTVAAFMNSEGGTLLIGVDDKTKDVLGLDNDFSTLKKQNLDGFQLQINSVLNKYVGAEYNSHMNVSFPAHNNVTICQVSVSKSSSPVFVTSEGSEYFYIRQSGSSEPLSREQQSKYEKEHWG